MYVFQQPSISLWSVLNFVFAGLTQTWMVGPCNANQAALNRQRHGNIIRQLGPKWLSVLLICGANGEGRTPIPLREPDPKSGASANSATFAVTI
jgi:hypothetical protein